MNIDFDVTDAPVKIGCPVLIGPPCDLQGWPEREGQQGRVLYFNYDCGCGQTYPNDPMIGVMFPGGNVHEFWAEELTELPLLLAATCRKER